MFAGVRIFFFLEKSVTLSALTLMSSPVELQITISFFSVFFLPLYSSSAHDTHIVKYDYETQ